MAIETKESLRVTHSEIRVYEDGELLGGRWMGGEICPACGKRLPHGRGMFGFCRPCFTARQNDEIVFVPSDDRVWDSGIVVDIPNPPETLTVFPMAIIKEDA